MSRVYYDILNGTCVDWRLLEYHSGLLGLGDLELKKGGSDICLL